MSHKEENLNSPSHVKHTNKKGHKMWYYILFGLGTLLLFSATIYDKRANAAKEAARSTTEEERQKQYAHDQANLLRAISAAENVRQEYQRKLQVASPATNPVSLSNKVSFASVEANLAAAMKSLPETTVNELTALQERARLENSIRQLVFEWEKKFGPEIATSLATIFQTIRTARDSGLVKTPSISEVPQNLRTMRSDYTPETSQVISTIYFETGISWEVSIHYGYVGLANTQSKPSATTAPSVGISWRTANAGGGTTTFQYSLESDEVTLHVSEQLFPKRGELVSKYKGAELVGNVTAEMLQLVYRQSLNPPK